MRPHLALVPFDERRIDGHETDPAAHAQCREHGRLAEADHRDVERTADFQQARLLEMADHEGIIASLFGFKRVADRLRGAAEFRQRVKQMVGRVEAMDLEPDAGTGHGVQQALQPFNVRRLLDRMDEALVPQPRRR